MESKTVEFVICAGSRLDVTKEVNEKLKQGWQLHGDIFHVSYTTTKEEHVCRDQYREVARNVAYFSQAMVRCEPIPKIADSRLERIAAILDEATS